MPRASLRGEGARLFHEIADDLREEPVTESRNSRMPSSPLAEEKVALSAPPSPVAPPPRRARPADRPAVLTSPSVAEARTKPATPTAVPSVVAAETPSTPAPKPSPPPPADKTEAAATLPPATEVTAPAAGATTPNRPGSTAPRPSVPPAVPSERVHRLEERLEELRRRALQDVSSSAALSERVNALLKRARENIGARGEALDAAEQYLQEVETILERAAHSVAAGRRYGRRILVYESAWLILLLAVLLFDGELAAGFSWLTGRGAIETMGRVLPFWVPLVWGSIGGASGSLYRLYRHISLRDYDPEHNFSFIVHPITGMAVGGLVYLLAALIAYLIGETGFFRDPVTVTNPLGLFALLLGFQQRHLFGVWERLMRWILRAPTTPEERP